MKKRSIWPGFIAATIICVILWVLLSSLFKVFDFKSIALVTVIFLPLTLFSHWAREYYRRFPLFNGDNNKESLVVTAIIFLIVYFIAK